MRQNRRGVRRPAAAVGSAVALRLWPFRFLSLPAPAPASAASAPARVVLIKTDRHREGVQRGLRLTEALPLEGRAGGAREITIADRSGMGDTSRVMREKGLDVLARELGVRLVALETQPPSAWRPRTAAGWHWTRGVLFPVLFEQADGMIQTCCLKTHRFGGQFTLSLKNSVGMVARTGPDGYDYMQELHGSARQRTLIAA